MQTTPTMDIVRPFHGVIVMQTTQKTHVSANQQADTCSCSWAVPFQYKKQASVSLSTTEAEYYALGIAFQEAIWSKQIFQELRMLLNNSILTYSDNTGAVALSDNPVFS